LNYYEHHIGDYAEATAHLSCLEDGVYSRLIRKYYAQEKPLPAELKAVQRLISARSKDEREAVEAILEEFFELQEDGWHNARCDEEIARYQEKQRKAKASADARWNKNKTQVERNANGMRTHAENDANASDENHANGMRTHCEGNAHQSPVTRHQLTSKAEDIVVINGSSRAHGDDDDDRPPREARMPPRQDPLPSNDAAIQLTVRLRQLGVNALFTHPAVQDWTNRQVPVAILEQAVLKAREVKGDTAKIPPNYLVNIVEELLNPPAKVEATAKAPREDWSWKRSNEGIDAKGRELGMYARGNESYADFAARIQAALDKRKAKSQTAPQGATA
jgi:uncharacterized protein YdaU (DUF1376 family)